MKTRYSQLQYRKREEPEQYHGSWKGEPVEFSRMFRGHRFTDAECQALCRDEVLEVCHLKGKDGIPYAVRGKLERIDRGLYQYVGFKVQDVLTAVPDYMRLKARPISEKDLNPVEFQMDPSLLNSSAAMLTSDERQVDYDHDVSDAFKVYDDYDEPDDLDEEDTEEEAWVQSQMSVPVFSDDQLDTMDE